MNYYLDVLKKYAEFTGRARRKEYWMFVLFNFIVSIVLGRIDAMLGTVNSLGVGYIGGLYSLVVLIPSIAVGVRRLHDIGKSGWMLLVVFIPIVGFIWLIVLLATDSTPGENQYGPNPKEGEFNNAMQ